MLALLFLVSLVPPAARIEGRVVAAESRSPIAHAEVRLPGLGRSARADTAGAFVLEGVPAGSWRVRVRALGYRAHEASVGVPEGGVVRLEFGLEADPIAVDPVRVRGRSGAAAPASPVEAGGASGPGPVRVDAAVVSRLPALAEPDLFRALQSLPSVQAGSDFSSALYVRGGMPDHNLLLLDGAPLFNPYHLGGLFSAFDPHATEWVGLLPGAFPAGVGDRLASAVDVRTRDGGRDRVRAGGALGLVSSRASVDGPLPGGRGSYLVSARRTYLDLIAGAAHALDLIPGSLPYGFTDGVVKLTHDVGRGRLSASAYVDDEGFAVRASDWASADYEPGTDERAVFDWGSRMASLAYEAPVGASLRGELRAGISDFHGTFGFWRAPWDSAAAEHRPDRTRPFLDAATRQRDLFAGAGLTWTRGGRTARLGLQYDDYLLDHDVFVERGQLGDAVPSFRYLERPWTLAAYAEEEWSVSDALSLRGGVRVLHAGEHGTEWLPRAGARLAVSPRLSLSLGASRSAQVLQSLKREESVWSSLVAYDLLGAVPRGAGLSTAEDLVAGAEWAGERTRLRVDAYRKWMHRLPLAPLPDDVAQSPVIVPDSFHLGEGSARGVELLAEHVRGRATFSLSYALTAAELRAGGERYAPRYERRHFLDASASLPLGRRGLLSARLAWATGQPYTPVAGTTRGYGYDPVDRALTPGGGPYDRTLVLGEHNGARLPAYFRLDLGVRRDFTRRWWGREVTLTPYFSVLNALNTPNVLFAIPQSEEGTWLEYPPQLPVFPSFGVEWRF